MRTQRFALAAIVLLYAAMAAVGITWGLPSTRIDKYLFGEAPPWPGEKIARLAKVAQKNSPTRGADVDANPLDLTSNGPIHLTATEADAAAIYLRYRLYTHQPDEMITMMALAGMKPRQSQLDPKLYQYGGLFIYPVGAAIGLCGALGLVHVTSDLTYYLDHPDEFGKFYLIARAYVALWGALGVVLVYAIASRLSRTGFQPVNPQSAIQNPQCFGRVPHPSGVGDGPIGQAAAPAPAAAEQAKAPSPTLNPHSARSLPAAAGTPPFAGLLAALLFALMPITVCMSHEAKPHLPGAVLMLSAVWFAMRYTQTESRKPKAEGSTPLGPSVPRSLGPWLLMCACCGAAFGMVLSALPIFILIPIAEFLRTRAIRSEISILRSPHHSLDPSVPQSLDPSAHSFRTPHSALRVLMGFAIACGVYLVTNPYVAINAVFNRELLLSNLRNSTAMYEVGRIGEGLIRVLELIAEGATPALLVAGLIGMAWLWRMGRHAFLPLLAPAALVAAQFVLLGAGKPDEYGRFGVFIAAALAIAAACALARFLASQARPVGLITTVVVVALTAHGGWKYLHNFRADAGPNNTRNELAAILATHSPVTEEGQVEALTHSALRTPHSALCILSDPAPYNCPPMDFSRVRLLRYPSFDAYVAEPRAPLLRPVDSQLRMVDMAAGWRATQIGRPPYSPISWANKPFDVIIPP